MASIFKRTVTEQELVEVRRDYEEFRKWFFDPSYTPRCGGFRRKLFDLIGSADPINKKKIAMVFPAEAYVALELMGELHLLGDIEIVPV